MKNFNLHTISYLPMLPKQAWGGDSVFISERDNIELGVFPDIS
jgi:hypothetical protein